MSVFFYVRYKRPSLPLQAEKEKSETFFNVLNRIQQQKRRFNFKLYAIFTIVK